jgi:hypothetical protein
MHTVEAVEGELELGRIRFWEGDGEAVERGVRRAEDSEQGLEEDAALQRRGRRRRSRGVEVVVVEEVAREGDRAVRRPRAVERVQVQLMKRQTKRTRKNQLSGGREATRLGGEPCRGAPGGRARRRRARGRSRTGRTYAASCRSSTAPWPQSPPPAPLHSFSRRLLCFGWGQRGGRGKRRNRR